MTVARIKAYRRGLWAEALSRLALRLKGYRILESRYRTGLGEVDIVALRGKVVALVEVKARSSRQGAADSVASFQKARIARAASLFLSRHPEYAGCSVRLDVMLVVPFRWPLHLEGGLRG